MGVVVPGWGDGEALWIQRDGVTSLEQPIEINCSRGSRSCQSQPGPLGKKTVSLAEYQQLGGRKNRASSTQGTQELTELQGRFTILHPRATCQSGNKY